MAGFDRPLTSFEAVLPTDAVFEYELEDLHKWLEQADIPEPGGLLLRKATGKIKPQQKTLL